MGKSRHLLTLYLLIAVLASYVGLDLLGKSECGGGGRQLGLTTAPPEAAVVAEEEEKRRTEVCSTLEGHYNGSLSSWDRSRGDPWRQLKWVGEPAYCRVRGQLIEKLDDENNFRRGFALRHSVDVEDRLHILPWLLGSRIDLGKSGRRVYLDLGANYFRTSVVWFSQMYPCDFTEIHAFEKERTLFHMPAQGFEEDANWVAQPIKNAVRVKESPQLPQWMLDRISLYNQYVADADDPLTSSVNITRFIKEELMLTPADTVVVKMDIEAAEWPILRRWISDPEMALIVDELFVEVHYGHPSMTSFGWSQFYPRTREEAKMLLAELRFRGFYAHFWP